MMGGGGGLGGMLGGGGMGGSMGGGMMGGGMGSPMSGGMGGGLGGMLGGGLGGLLQQFQQRGHGDTIDSWVGTGPNRAISPTELHEALGPDTVDHLSQQTGMPQQDLLSELSNLLPDAVDKLTPHGRLPEDHEQAQW
jgi:uncharacterized protein YidB (DUF937 family)